MLETYLKFIKKDALDVRCGSLKGSFFLADGLSRHVGIVEAMSNRKCIRLEKEEEKEVLTPEEFLERAWPGSQRNWSRMIYTPNDESFKALDMNGVSAGTCTEPSFFFYICANFGTGKLSDCDLSVVHQMMRANRQQ